MMGRANRLEYLQNILDVLNSRKWQNGHIVDDQFALVDIKRLKRNLALRVAISGVRPSLEKLIPEDRSEEWWTVYAGNVDGIFSMRLGYKVGQMVVVYEKAINIHDFNLEDIELYEEIMRQLSLQAAEELS